MNPKLDSLQDPNAAEVDKLISEIAEAYISEVGWEDVLDSLQVLNKAESHVVHHMEFSPMGWIGAHLLSVLSHRVDEEALKNGRCGNDGAELEYRKERQTRDSPGYEWLECSKCGEQYPCQR